MNRDRDLRKLARDVQGDEEDLVSKSRLKRSLRRIPHIEAIYSEDEREELAELLNRPSPAQVSEALSKLHPGRSPKPILRLIGNAVYSANNEARKALINYAIDNCVPEELHEFLKHHPFLGYKNDTYCWYSERTYNPDGEEVLDYLRDFLSYDALYTPLIAKDETLRESYRRSLHIAWITFHQAEVEPQLRQLLNSNPDDSDTIFYLGQIYQDALIDLDRAKAYFKRFLELKPNHEPENNFIPETWYFNYHKYKPSSVEAWTNLAVIEYAQTSDLNLYQSLLKKAVDSSPNSHLAPYPQLAELALEKGEFVESAQFYEDATRTYRKARFTNSGFLPNCEYYESLNAWLIEKYPHFQRAFRYDGSFFLEDREALVIEAYRSGLDPAQCLKIIGPLRKERKRCRVKVNPEILLIQMEIVFNVYKDYYQVGFLAALIPDNEHAKEWAQRANQKLGRN